MSACVRNASSSAAASINSAAHAARSKWTYSTEAVLSPNKPYLLVKRRVVSIGGPCVHDFYFLLRKEPAAFARFAALPEHFPGHFRPQLPGPNVKTARHRPLNVLY